MRFQSRNINLIIVGHLTVPHKIRIDSFCSIVLYLNLLKVSYSVPVCYMSIAQSLHSNLW